MGRAATKRSLLESSGLSDPTLADAGLDWDRLLRWYFEERLGRGVPADVDRYSKDLGFEGKDAFQASVVREYCFLQRVPIAR